eukprot:TRINITY_DN89_c0_g2_i1.p1 TRINITY_DN89_c0_g2~~TRINITY_DN89_c0_g2_i1.p1  ORF type:complete len:195 (+),score=39.26 TRINITY_DN89_c0_g2_i1:72-656(+)
MSTLLRPLVIAGPSGVGKGTLIKRLMDEFPSSFGFSVSHTTRLPRPGEIDGVHYHFTTREVMEKAIANGEFIEFANVVGNFYGTSKKAVEVISQAQKMCILDIDVQGCESVKKTGMPAIFVFITPPSIAELEKRLRGRGTETEESIQKRLNTAARELLYLEKPGFFDHVIVNDVLDDAYSELKKVVSEELEKLK